MGVHVENALSSRNRDGEPGRQPLTLQPGPPARTFLVIPAAGPWQDMASSPPGKKKVTPNPRASEHPPGLLFRSSAGERPAPLRQLRPAGVPGRGTPRPGCRGRAPQRPTREPKDGVLAATSSGRSQQAGRRPSAAPSRTPSQLLPRGRALSGRSLTAEGGLPGSHPCPVLELTVWPCGPLDMPRDFERVTARGPSLRSCPLASRPCLPRLFTPSGFRKVPVGRAICSLLQCH